MSDVTHNRLAPSDDRVDTAVVTTHQRPSNRRGSPAALSTVALRLRGRAWSRAGAVADVLAKGPTRRVLGLTRRVLLLVFGSFVISTSVAVTLWNELGPGPLDVFIGAIRLRTGLPLAVVVWGVVGSLIVAAWALGRRPGLGTLLSPLMIGPMLQSLEAVLGRFDPPGSMMIRVVLHVVAVGGIGVGSGALIVSGLGAGTGELLAGAASDRAGRSETTIRPAMELTWIVAGLALGGPAGIGTIIVAVLVGPAVAHGYRGVDRFVAASARTVTQTHGAIIARELQHHGEPRRR